jgi:hypothetical protein
MDSTPTERARATDPENLWLSHMPKRRLEAEAIRDAILATSGELDLVRPEGSPLGALEGRLIAEIMRRAIVAQAPVRSVHPPIVRDAGSRGTSRDLRFCRAFRSW